MLKYIHIFS